LDTYDRATRILLALLATAVAVSVVHYVDNYANYADYPVPEPGSALPAPSRALVGASWFVFTACGVVGILLWRRRRIVPAAIALTAYSVSGLVGFGHYTVPGATEMVWWRQAHVVVDILCGLAIFGFALWAVTRARTLESSARPGHVEQRV
jgi:hypothetical protein